MWGIGGSIADMHAKPHVLEAIKGLRGNAHTQIGEDRRLVVLLIAPFTERAGLQPLAFLLQAPPARSLTLVRLETLFTQPPGPLLLLSVAAYNL